MRLKFFYDLMSQPSRALYILLKLNKIPFEPVAVDLGHGVHYTDDFKNNVNRFQKVPVLHDGDFKLAESIAIVRYLAREFPIADHWYPKDSKLQARVDEYLEWQHTNTRAFCARYFLYKFIQPKFSGIPPNPEILESRKKDMINCVDQIETLWLSQGHNYIAGDVITVADLFAASELEQPRMVLFDPAEGRPKLAAWWERVKKETHPYYEEATVVVNKIKTKQQAKEDFERKSKL